MWQAQLRAYRAEASCDNALLGTELLDSIGPVPIIHRASIEEVMGEN